MERTRHRITWESPNECSRCSPTIESRTALARTAAQTEAPECAHVRGAPLEDAGGPPFLYLLRGLVLTAALIGYGAFVAVCICWIVGRLL